MSGAGEEELEILSTRNGPLLGALLPDDANARSLALRWVGSEGPSGFEALMRLQHSGSWQGFRRALEAYPGPVATFLYADARQIGLQVAGNLPIRAVQTTLLPVVGGSRFYDWRGFILSRSCRASMARHVPGSWLPHIPWSSGIDGG